MPMHRLTVPGIFWRDHIDRCADHPGERIVIGSEDSRRVVVELDDEALKNLRSDADYYSDGVVFAGETQAYRSLINSARATVRALARVYLAAR